MTEADLIERLQASPISGFRRLDYLFQDKATSTGHPLEVAFADGTAIVCWPAGNGEELNLREGPYIDPWAAETPADRDYLATHGKYVAIDVSDAVGYRGLVGRVAAAAAIVNDRGHVVGVTLAGPSAEVRIEIVADEVQVSVNTTPASSDIAQR